MAENNWLLGDKPNPLGDRVDEIRDNLRRKNPERLAGRTGALYTPIGESNGEFRLPYWSREVVLNFPDFSCKFADTEDEINTFDQIPGGLFYAQAFQGYSGGELAKVFGDDADAFINANEKLSGRREFFGNVAYSYQILPRVPIMVVCWLGDEDFPSSYRMLFDSNAHHHLVTDGYAILGSNLARRLIKLKSDD